MSELISTKVKVKERVVVVKSGKVIYDSANFWLKMKNRIFRLFGGG